MLTSIFGTKVLQVEDEHYRLHITSHQGTYTRHGQLPQVCSLYILLVAVGLLFLLSYYDFINNIEHGIGILIQIFTSTIKLIFPLTY